MIIYKSKLVNDLRVISVLEYEYTHTQTLVQEFEKLVKNSNNEFVTRKSRRERIEALNLVKGRFNEVKRIMSILGLEFHN